MAQSSIGRFTRIPHHIATAKMSSRAREVWTLIASNGSPQKPEVWVRQQSLADALDCSTDTIGRAIKELTVRGFIAYTGKRHQGRHKFYYVFWMPPCDQNTLKPPAFVRKVIPQKCALTFRKTSGVHTAKQETHIPQKCQNLIRVVKKIENKNNSSKKETYNVQTRSSFKVFRSDTPSPKETRPQKAVAFTPATPASKDEVAWITSKIKMTLQKESLDCKELRLPKLAICEENYPVMWGFLRTQWQIKKA